MADDDPGESQPCQFVPGLGGRLAESELFHAGSRSRRVERAAIGQPFLHLLERQGIAVIHQLFIQPAMDPFKPRIECVGRVRAPFS